MSGAIFAIICLLGWICYAIHKGNEAKEQRWERIETTLSSLKEELYEIKNVSVNILLRLTRDDPEPDYMVKMRAIAKANEEKTKTGDLTDSSALSE